MTVSSTINRVQYTADGSLATYAYPFRVFNESDLYITLYNGTTETETTAFTATGVGDSAGGNIVFDSTPANGIIITIERVVPITQETDYVENSPFQADTHEDALDKLTMIDQQLYASITKALRYPNTDSSSLSSIIPNATTRATKVLGFDSNGEPTVTSSSIASIDGIIAAAREDGTVISNNSFTGDGVTTQFTIDANPINRDALIIQVGGVLQEPNTYSVDNYVVTFTEAPPLNVPFSIRNIGYQKGGLLLERTNYLSKYESISAALTSIGSADATLIIDEAFTLTTNTTIPSNINLEWKAGCLVSGAYTLTINGGISAREYQLFNSNVTVNGSPFINYTSPYWFGAVGNGVTDDSSAIQKACDFVNSSGGGVVMFSPGQYLIESSIVYTGWRGVTLSCFGSNKGWASSDETGSGIINTGKVVNIITSGNIPAFYGTQGNTSTTRTRDVVLKGLSLTGNSASLSSGNYGVEWYQSDASIFSGIITLDSCRIYGFENGVRITAVSGAQATGWWRIKDCIIQGCYWGVYAPGGVNDCQITGGAIYQNDTTAATNNLVTDTYGGGVYGRGTAWSINGVDLEANSVGIYLYGTSGFNIGNGCYFEVNNTAAIVLNSCKDGVVGGMYNPDQLVVIANCQSISVPTQQLSYIMYTGQNRNISCDFNKIIGNDNASTTTSYKCIYVTENKPLKIIPEARGVLESKKIVCEAINTTMTKDDSSTDIPSPIGGSQYVTKLTTTAANQYARTYLSNGAWSAGDYLNGLMYLYVPTAFTGTITVTLTGSAGSETAAALSYYPRDEWFVVNVKCIASTTSTYTDFRVSAGSSGQVFYIFKPTLMISDYDIEPFIVWQKLPVDLPVDTTNPVYMPGNAVCFGPAFIMYGTGSPEGVVVGYVGSIFIRTDGGTSTTMYLKESGGGLTTGWVAK